MGIDPTIQTKTIEYSKIESRSESCLTMHSLHLIPIEFVR
jgi:hypothetical protein